MIGRVTREAELRLGLGGGGFDWPADLDEYRPDG